MEHFSKNDPRNLLSKPSYKTLVLKMKAPFLNNICSPCCYAQENSYKLYKWIPNDPQYDIVNGMSGKRILKIKEQSSCCMRTCAPASCRGYEALIQSENNRKVLFSY